MKKRRQIGRMVVGFLGMVVFGMGMIGSCESRIGDTVEKEIDRLEMDSMILEEDNKESLIDEQIGLEQTAFPEIYMIEDIVNIEEVDFTQDGVMDKAVSKIYYSNEDKMQGKKTDCQWTGGFCKVCIYDGNGLTEKEIAPEEKNIVEYLGSGMPVVPYGRIVEGNCIWEKDYATAHAGNGWLFLTTYNGKNCLLSVSNGIWQGAAVFQYQVISFTEECKEVIEKENEVKFTMYHTAPGGGTGTFPIDEMIAYTEDLRQQLENSILLVYTDVEQGAKIRTFEEECTINVFDAWDWLKEYNNGNDFTIESLRETMEKYYKEVWTEGMELEQTAEDTVKWNEIVVNVEEADLTHDGVMDKIVSRIYYPSWEEGKSVKELLEGCERCYVSVYDGNGLIEDGINFNGTCIWEKAFSGIHPENGQLYLLNKNGEDYLIWNSDYSIMGHGCYNYRVFYLTGKQEEIGEIRDGHLASTLGKVFGEGEERVVAEDSGHFSYTNKSGQNIEFPIEHLISYTENLNTYLKDSVLLVYCNTSESRIRTFEESCSASVFELWKFLIGDRDREEITMETLREEMERYYREEWNLE